MGRRAIHSAVTVVAVLVHAVAAVAGVSLVLMMALICADVLMRVLGRPMAGIFDLVGMLGALTIACALPYTTAVKGHVAVEYFFLKLSRRGRIVVDTTTRLVTAILFAVLAWRSLGYGAALRRSGEVSATLKLPIFWLPWVIAFCCVLVVAVILLNMLRPGRELIKP